MVEICRQVQAGLLLPAWHVDLDLAASTAPQVGTLPAEFILRVAHRGEKSTNPGAGAVSDAWVRAGAPGVRNELVGDYS